MENRSIRAGWRANPRGYSEERDSARAYPYRNDDVDEEWMERLSWLMDRSIPIGNWSIGLDPILGLIPGFGDAAGALISGYIIMQAHRAGVPRSTVLRMVANVGIESVVGAVPVLGDIFDASWKANTRNMVLYREARLGHANPRADWAFLAMVIAILVAIFVIPLVLLILIVRAIF